MVLQGIFQVQIIKITLDTENEFGKFCTSSWIYLMCCEKVNKQHFTFTFGILRLHSQSLQSLKA